MRYKHLRIMFHAEAVMAARILSFLSVHMSSSACAFQGEKTELLFLPIYVYCPKLGALSSLHLGCVCNYTECETTYSEFLLSVSSQKTPLKGRKNHVLFQGC